MGRGGRAGIYGRREKRRGSAARAFPNRAAAKLGGADRTTEITIIKELLLKLSNFFKSRAILPYYNSRY
jgi:hypothetical protein